MFMLDTNICIYAIKRKPEQVFQRIFENRSSGLCISSISLAELEYGIAKSAYPQKNATALNKFLVLLNVLPFDEAAAREYGTICADLQKRGTPIGTMDMLIAGHAKAANCSLVTNNVKEFQRVSELEIVNWTDPKS